MVPQISATILQGSTFALPLIREYWPYPVRFECGQWVKDGCGTPAPDSDKTAEDYTGCTARMQLRRSIDALDVISERTTENGGIALVGNKLTVKWSAAETSDFKYGSRQPAWCTAVGQVEVIRPNGDVERQYEITFSLDPEGTR
ncbi:MAG: hypothetical protein LBE61_09780 [Burkholderiaceae bacterium]|jgi:hypothetical protein|nr:hypothetical protein [Burkholderiaceae bacterium]